MPQLELPGRLFYTDYNFEQFMKAYWLCLE